MSKLKQSISTEKKEIPFCFDLLFKKMFGDEHNLNPLRTVIKRTLSLYPEKLVILNSELINRPYKDKKAACDLVAEIDDGTKINFEVNTQVDQTIVNRNVRLLCLNMGKDLQPNEDYSEIKSQKQLNFDLKGKHDKPICKYSLMENETHSILTDTIEIIRYDVPYFKKLCYTTNINNLDGLSRLIALFGAKNLEEVKYICKGDEELEEIQKQYEKYVNDEDVIGAYDYELHQRELARVEREQAVEEAIEETAEKVTKEVTKKVTEQSKIEIAKNLLRETKDFSFISRVTGLDIDIIEGLQ